ncbi:sigma-70 family RNA polymerase sigma factor [Roseiconus nitratireducens]|uniref:Sigma-70 family RNA polymerase sigma factor n=1 Tax=Roseiconus nitratireducens TaxID=2605748 RepID=A0A5M6D4H8_9BACT|nr:ECF-type sigma factor [Roseiconus nitratireducens]KAA5541490.1 sigma-70 family RNA polymerase sigma factor [Roseiconus nitratireducens]
MAPTFQHTHPEVFDYAIDMTQRVASLVQYRPEFKHKLQDDDLQQEFLLYVLEHIDQYDSKRGDHKVFVNMLIRNCIAKLIRENNRMKSRPPAGMGLESTDEVIETVDGTHEEMFRSLGIDDKDRRTLGESSDPFEQMDMTEGVEHLIRTLPRGYRKIARKLMACSRAEAGRELGISRRRMAQAVEVIREHFGKADWLAN